MSARLTLHQVRVTLAAFELRIDLDRPVDFLGLFGPSGAGKTTLLETIAGLRRPREGRIELDGECLADAGERLFVPPHRRAIGYVPQDLALFPHLSVAENIRYGLRAAGTRRGPELDAIVEVLEIAPLLPRRPDTLSGGQAQRVALARALASRPRLLLLDEPLTGLEEDLRGKVADYLLRIRKTWGTPMIYVSHQAAEMMSLCDEVILIEQGRVTAQGRPHELFAAEAQPHFRLREGLGSHPEPRDISA